MLPNLAQIPLSIIFNVIQLLKIVAQVLDFIRVKKLSIVSRLVLVK
jgi:hypothetical protein